MRELKVSDFIDNNDWFSFVKKSIVESTPFQFESLVEKYFAMSKQYNIQFTYSIIDISLALLITHSYQKDIMNKGKTLTTVINNSYVNYVWPNGFLFLNMAFEKFPVFIEQFINNDKITSCLYRLILDVNRYSISLKEKEPIYLFFGKIIPLLNQENFETLYKKSHLYLRDSYFVTLFEMQKLNYALPGNNSISIPQVKI